MSTVRIIEDIIMAAKSMYFRITSEGNVSSALFRSLNTVFDKLLMQYKHPECSQICEPKRINKKSENKSIAARPFIYVLKPGR